MKEIFEKGRKPACDADQPSPMRRKLLVACAYLPTAPLLAMLGGCEESAVPDTSTFEVQDKTAVVDAKLDLKLPPFKTTDELGAELEQKIKLADELAAQLNRKIIEVTHVPEKTPPASTPKTVGIYSLQYNAFTQISTRGQALAGTPEGDELKSKSGGVEFISADPQDKTKTITTIYEGIETYLKRALDNRFALLYRAMVTGFQKHSPKEFDVSFFTAPEFYWSVPFGDFLTEAELQVAGDICQAIVTKNARTLISKFPADQYGNIVLLPGTIATLKANDKAVKADGAPAGEIIYTASNHLTCTHNLPLNDSKYPRPAYMIWPKRTVSGIDFIDEEHNGDCNYGNSLVPNPTHPGLDNPIMECELRVKSGLKVKIEHVTSSLAQSFDINGNLLSSKFNNRIVEDLPFGVDICLDYYVASLQQDPVRFKQLDEQEFKLDFLIAAGMSLDINNYATTPFIQYAIRNEGYGGDDGKTGEIQVMKLNWTKGVGKRLGTLSSKDLEPLDSDKQTKGDILINATDAFVAPKGSITSDIPNILDEMNPGIVRIWSLDVDQPVEEVVASKTALTKTLAEKAIQFIK